MILCAINVNGQKLDGAYTSTEDGIVRWLLIADNCFTWTKYTEKEGQYINTIGGTFTNNATHLKPTIEFNPYDTTEVGQSFSWSYTLKENVFTIKLDENQDGFSFTKSIENSNELSGAFLFSGRKRNGEISRRNTDQPRKTMKMLVGDRFQWIAYHVTDKKFHGTGGGNFSSKDGIYTENIEFFSRNQDRVGASLNFEYEIIDGDWHHTGKSSKGDPLYEIWSKRQVQKGF